MNPPSNLYNASAILGVMSSNSPPAPAAEIKGALPLGDAQCPGLSDYADGVDTMEFLINL